MIPSAVTEFFEAADRVFQRRDLARLAGEHFGDQERLRKEAFDAPCSVDHQLILFAQFIHAQDGDNILQVFVALQNLLHLTRSRIVILTDHDRIEDAGGRVERVHRRVDPQLGNLPQYLEKGLQAEVVLADPLPRLGLASSVQASVEMDKMGCAPVVGLSMRGAE